MRRNPPPPHPVTQADFLSRHLTEMAERLIQEAGLLQSMVADLKKGQQSGRRRTDV